MVILKSSLCKGVSSGEVIAPSTAKSTYHLREGVNDETCTESQCRADGSQHQSGSRATEMAYAPMSQGLVSSHGIFATI